MHRMETANFESFLLRRGIKQTTRYRHLLALRKLQREVGVFTPSNLENYFLNLLKERKKPRYVNTLVNTVKVYGVFIGDESLVKFKLYPEDEVLKSVMADEEIEKFLAVPPPTVIRKSRHGTIDTYQFSPDGYNHWTLFFKICAYTGMRPGEVANLQLSDVQFGLSVFTVRESKTKKPRMVPIPPNLTAELEEAVARCKGLFLFPSRNGGNGGQYKGKEAVFSDVQWNYQFNTRLKRLGVRKRPGLTPYSLRHSFITRLLEEDVNLFKVQKIVGHRRLETTAGYTHLTTKDTQLAIKKHPLIRKHTDPKFILNHIAETVKTMGLDQDARFSYKFVLTENEINLQVKIV